MRGAAGSPLRVAVAGAGFASGMHLPAWSRLAAVEIVAICDPVRSRAEKRARAFGIARVFTDAAAMLDEVRPDAIDIAAPVEAHAPLCRLAAERGIHILCQKPLASTLAAAAGIAEAVEGRVRLMVHENWRFRAHYRMIKGWLDERSIGDIVSCLMQVRASGLRADAQGSIPQLVRQPGFAGIARLMIGEVLVHHLDVLRWLLGPLTVIAARTRRVCSDVSGEDAALVVLEGHGFWVALEGNFTVPGAPAVAEDRLEITGTQGLLRLEGGNAYINGPHERSATFDLGTGYADSYAASIAHFAEALATDAPFETDVRDNLETLKLVEDSYCKAGRLPP